MTTPEPNLPTTPEEAERAHRVFTLAETATITGKLRQQLQRWIKRGAIAVFDRGPRGSYQITGAQVAEIMRHPKDPSFVRPISLEEARNRKVAQQTRRAREAAELAAQARRRVDTARVLPASAAPRQEEGTNS